jgi:hypothetical protein
MSIKFPRYRPKNTGVIETEELNESFRTIADEATGALNAHNVADEAFALSRKTQFTDDVAYRVHVAQEATATNYSNTQAWTSIFSSDILTVGTLLWINAALQISGVGGSSYSQFLVAISIDGRQATEALLGRADDNPARESLCAFNAVSGATLDTIQVIPPGEHRIDIMIKVTGFFNGIFPTVTPITNKQITVLEMVR